MNVDDIFPSKWLKAADLKGQRIKVVIANVQVEDIGGEDKPVMHFQGKDKGMVLNRTNAGCIAAVYGDELDGWAGREIVLYSTKVPFQGRMVDALRVSVPEPEPTPAGDDDIPF